MLFIQLLKCSQFNIFSILKLILKITIIYNGLKIDYNLSEKNFTIGGGATSCSSVLLLSKGLKNIKDHFFLTVKNIISKAKRKFGVSRNKNY